MEFIGSLEFYIMMLAVAMAVVGIAMRPSVRGAAITSFARGAISPASGRERSVLVECCDDGIAVRRCGVYVDSPDCEINYSIVIIGSDIKISEKRFTGGIAELRPMEVDVEFTFIPPRHGKYHFFLESEWSGEWASGTISTSSSAIKTLATHH